MDGFSMYFLFSSVLAVSPRMRLAALASCHKRAVPSQDAIWLAWADAPPSSGLARRQTICQSNSFLWTRTNYEIPAVLAA